MPRDSSIRFCMPRLGKPSSSVSGAASRSPAFSLLELLIVIALLGLLLVLTVPVISSMSRSRDVTSAAYGIRDLLEFARTEAMAGNTYTWVGFANLASTDAGNGSGRYQTVGAVYRSLNGTATATGDSVSPVAKVTRFPNVKLVDPSEVNAQVKQQFDASVPVALVSSVPKNLPTIAGLKFKFTITFTPQGVALLKGAPDIADGFDDAVDIGLVQMAGDAKLGGPDDAVLRVYGASGGVKIYRLQ